MMRLPRISWFMIICGTPVTLMLLINYIFIVGPNVPRIVVYSILYETMSAGMYCGCLIGVMLSRLFQFDLGVSWSDISLIRMFSSGPILFMHPISLFFIDCTSLGALLMTTAWIVAVIDWKLNWKLFAEESTTGSNES